MDGSWCHRIGQPGRAYPSSQPSHRRFRRVLGIVTRRSRSNWRAFENFGRAGRIHSSSPRNPGEGGAGVQARESRWSCSAPGPERPRSTRSRNSRRSSPLVHRTGKPRAPRENPKPTQGGESGIGHDTRPLVTHQSGRTPDPPVRRVCAGASAPLDWFRRFFVGRRTDRVRPLQQLDLSHDPS